MLVKYKQQYSKFLTITGVCIVSIFMLFYCFDYLLQISISVFLPTIKQQFSINNFQLGMIGSVFFISYVLMQIPSGYLIDEIGAKKIAIIMALACVTGSVTMYFSSHFYLLLLSRFIIGFGSSAAFLCALYVISQWLPKKYFSIFVGLLQALAGMGAIFGQAPIAYINHYYSWNKIYLGFAIISLAFCGLFVFIVGRSTHTSHNKSDLNASKIPLTSYFSIFKNKDLLKLAVLGFIAWSPVASLAGFWIIPFLSNQYGFTPLHSSYMITTFWVGMICGSLLTPIISEWIKRRKPVLVFGFSLQLIAMCFICMNSAVVLVCIAMFLLGFVAPIQGFCIVIVNDIYKGKGFGIVSGFLNMLGALSGGVMQFLVGFFLSYVFFHSIHSYEFAFLSYLLLAVIAIYISITGIQESHPHNIQFKSNQTLVIDSL